MVIAFQATIKIINYVVLFCGAIVYYKFIIIYLKLKGKFMATSIQVDEILLQEAMDLSNYSTTTALIETALSEYIQRRKQLQIIGLFGNIDYQEGYNYKQQRWVV